MLDNMVSAHLLTILHRSQNSICDYFPRFTHMETEAIELMDMPKETWFGSIGRHALS